MNNAVDHLIKAQKHAMSIRPKVGGFPYLAEALRQAGVTRNLWSLPSCQSVYYTNLGVVVQQGEPLVSGTTVVEKFDRERLIQAIRADQAGETTFPEFLKKSWAAGVIGYDVDLTKRKVTYSGALGESYCEDYLQVEI